VAVRLALQSVALSSFGNNEKEGQFLNLSGLLHGTFHQHLDGRFEVPWLGGHFVPIAAIHL